MDLSALGNTLPPGLADAEREMGDKFRAAALSITNLYKSSLGYTKQAYHAGYAACLQDVLSTVQSAIAGGQDAEQTLSRLMDWAEARETAMAAFAAEDIEDVPPPRSARPAQLRQALSTISVASGPALSRPSSAPPIDKASHHAPYAPSHSTATEDGIEDSPIPGPSRPLLRLSTASNAMTPSSVESTPAHAGPSRMHMHGSSATPSALGPTSSPTLLHRDLKGLGKRYSPLKARTTGLPSSVFAPSLPSAPAHLSIPIQQPEPNHATGTKRPLPLAMSGEAMDVEDGTGHAGQGAAAVPLQAQTQGQTQGKRKKHRREREEEEKREGAGQGGLGGQGPGGAGKRGGGGRRHGGALA